MESPPRHLTLIICTRNQSRSLDATLGHIAKCSFPDALSCDVLVVDNASTDSTADVVQSHAQGYPVPLSLIHEPKPGKNRAVNRALDEARGDILVFTDDDIRPERSWLRLLIAPILDKTADCTTGRVRLPPDLHRPGMEDYHRMLLAIRESLEGDRIPYLIGANLAFHRRVLEKVPRFDPALGPGALGFHDETLFGWQLEEAGFRLKYVQEASVWHDLDPNRLTASNFRRHARRIGQGFGYLYYHWFHSRDETPGRLDPLRTRVEIWKFRLLHPSYLLPWNIPCYEELALHVRLGSWLQTRTEMRGPRKYAQKGLQLLPEFFEDPPVKP